ncbi:putative xanthine/uracil/vitamin C permease [Helianthus debilis subsp. tardiflorus]
MPILYIINDSSLQRITDHHDRFIHTMRAIQGALIVASSIQIVAGYSQLWGLFSRFFSPLGMAPAIGLVGLGLFQRGFPMVGNCVEIGLPILLLVIGVSQYLKHTKLLKDIPVFERFPLLICISIIWIYSIILTASGTYRNRPDPTQTSCRTDKAYIISTAPWLGIGVLLDGLYGTGTGSTVSVENVGLLGFTRVGSRRVVQISAGFMIFFSILGKFGAVFASIPFPIFAALYCVLFGLCRN